MYKTGQKVCLWQISNVPGSKKITVLKSVIVTITEIKTEAPCVREGKKVDVYSISGRGDDDKRYVKHWKQLSESQGGDYSPRWSIRDDGVFCRNGTQWIPVEAVFMYDVFRVMKQKRRLDRLVDQYDNDIRPEGDVVYCEKHDSYSHTNVGCMSCSRDTL
jgi:hypothetical protein